MQTIAIAAVADNGVIGNGPDIPWDSIPADWARFKALTSENYVVMGRSTYETLDTPLPNRTTIVVTRDQNYQVPAPIGATRVLVAHDIEGAFDLAARDRFAAADRIVWVAGGGQIYAETMNRLTALDITEVHQSPPGDVHFPAIDPQLWCEVQRQPHDGYEFVRYAPITRTDRLTLTPVTMNDFDAWWALHSDPRAFPQSPDAVLTDPNVCRERLVDHQQSWVEDGLGYWVARLKDGTFVATGGVKKLQTAGSGDFFWNLYFRVVPGYMGMGYATEIARAAIRELVRIDPHARVRLVRRTENEAIARVAEKLGLSPLTERLDEFGQPQAVYQGVAKDLKQG